MSWERCQQPSRHKLQRSLSPVSLCLASGALLGLLACAAALYAQRLQIEGLRGELAELGMLVRANGRPRNLQGEPSEELGGCVAGQCQGRYADSAAAQLRGEDSSSRRRRQSDKEGRGRTRRRSVLHLVPVSTETYEALDSTVILWRASSLQGDAFELSPAATAIKEDGFYYIYSQVLFHDWTFLMGQVVMKAGGGESRGNESTRLLTCFKSMPKNAEQAYNTCFSAGVYFLEKGSVLQLSVPRFNAGIQLADHSTFMGLIQL